MRLKLKQIFVLLFVLLIGSALCGSDKLEFTIVHSSDEHSSLVPVPYAEYLSGGENQALGGFARLAVLLRQIRTVDEQRPVLLLSSGDYLGGTPFSWLTLASLTPELDIMQHLGYDAVAIGNHEFDYGPEVLAKYLLAAEKREKPQVLCANLVIPAGHPLEKSGIAAHCLKKLNNGLKVGIFALLGKDANRLAPAAKPLTFADQHEAAKKAAAGLSAAGAEIIIALTHAGYYEDMALAKAVPGIDLILGGHNHIVTDSPIRAGKTLIMHSGAYLQSVGRLELSYDRDSRRLSLRNQEMNLPFIYRLDGKSAEDPEIVAMIDGAVVELNRIVASASGGRFADIGKTIVVSDFSLDRETAGSENSIGNFITDAMRLEVEKLTGRRVDLALHANGIIRGGLRPAVTESVAGNLSLYDLITVSSLGSGQDGRPGYGLVSFYLTEKEVMNLLEIGTLLPMMWSDTYFLQFSGLRYRYDPARAFWVWLPLINKPLPAYRSILGAEFYSGSGVQGEDGYRKLNPEGTALCHVVTTHYLATYLPMVGTRLPRLNLVLKDANGNPVELDQTILHRDGHEFKLWDATARYAAGFATSEGKVGRIPDYYRSVGGRIIKERGEPLWLWPFIVCVFIVALLLIFRRCRRTAPQLYCLFY